MPCQSNIADRPAPLIIFFKIFSAKKGNRKRIPNSIIAAAKTAAKSHHLKLNYGFIFNVLSVC